MTTRVSLDGRLLDEALRIGGKATKKETVTEALKEYIDRRKQAAVLDLFRGVDFDPKSTPPAHHRRAAPRS